MIILLWAILVGGAATFALLWPYGIIVALVGAPFGASSLAGLTALYLSRRGTHQKFGHNASAKKNLGRIVEVRTDLTR
ncbi:hypothetical protein [Microvirga alba]|uniref:Uncharacterized protein n=1 Tax=Microvirga alba TaxID=2791025 RepID=A0A931BNB9_9HYPH|nr:hypothetical protein [Microvirga alba]MBF9234421.1 hypothetical protein [Microvirga alba]